MSRFNPNCQWMETAGYGLMFTYLAGGAGTGAGVSYDPVRWWNEVASTQKKWSTASCIREPAIL